MSPSIILPLIIINILLWIYLVILSENIHVPRCRRGSLTFRKKSWLNWTWAQIPHLLSTDSHLPSPATVTSSPTISSQISHGLPPHVSLCFCVSMSTSAGSGFYIQYSLKAKQPVGDFSIISTCIQVFRDFIIFAEYLEGVTFRRTLLTIFLAPLSLSHHIWNNKYLTPIHNSIGLPIYSVHFFSK